MGSEEDRAAGEPAWQARPAPSAHGPLAARDRLSVQKAWTDSRPPQHLPPSIPSFAISAGGETRGVAGELPQHLGGGRADRVSQFRPRPSRHPGISPRATLSTGTWRGKGCVARPGDRERAGYRWKAPSAGNGVKRPPGRQAPDPSTPRLPHKSPREPDLLHKPGLRG